MKSLFVHISKAVMNWLYRLHCSSSTRGNEVVFLSRQTNEPSYDFTELAKEFESQGWTCHMHLKKVKAVNMLSYVGHVLQELKLLAKCQVVVLDRYDPVVSLIDFEYEPVSRELAAQKQAAEAEGRVLHVEFPAEPVIVQLWHAFGSYKKFGYQSVGTREGHLQRTIDTFNIHRNYSWIMCSGEACREVFAEAFAYPVERLVAYHRPEFFELLEIGQGKAQNETNAEALPKKVLFAPTLRKSKASAHPFRDLYEQRDAFQQALEDRVGTPLQLEWSFHPLELNLPAPGNASQALLEADIVVTDYSSIVYEAYLLRKPALFYVPDIEDYRESPGLNIDPANVVPSLCSATSHELIDQIAACLAEPNKAIEQLSPFATPAFDGEPAKAAKRTLLEAVAAAQKVLR